VADLIPNCGQCKHCNAGQCTQPFFDGEKTRPIMVDRRAWSAAGLSIGAHHVWRWWCQGREFREDKR
jgi:hypothetical protein